MPRNLLAAIGGVIYVASPYAKDCA